MTESQLSPECGHHCVYMKLDNAARTEVQGHCGCPECHNSEPGGRHGQHA